MYLYHLAPAANAPFLAAGPWKGQAGVFDLVTGALVSRFATSLDSGGRRLVMSPDGSTVVAAAWERHGISAHEATTGRLIWARKEIKGTGHLRVSADGRHLFVRSTRFSVLDMLTGAEVERRRGIEGIWEAEDEEYRLIQGTKYRVETRAGLHFTIPRLTFALLDCVFGPDFVAVTESGGPLRMLVLPRGRELWRVTPPEGVHILRLGFVPTAGRLVANEWPFFHGGTTHVLALNPASGSIEARWSGSDPGAEFCLGGTALAFPDGTLRDSLTGGFIRELEPVTDWPDLPSA